MVNTHAFIPLTQGLRTLVDYEDFLRFGDRSWATRLSGSKPYAVGQYGVRHGQSPRLLHRIIMDAPVGAQVDHINGNSLDNRRANLRLCSAKDNAANRYHPTGAAGFRGVTRDGARWRAQIKDGDRKVALGRFSDPADAARAYDERARIVFGSFAVLNFPRAGETGTASRQRVVTIQDLLKTEFAA